MPMSVKVTKDKAKLVAYVEHMKKAASGDPEGLNMMVAKNVQRLARNAAPKKTRSLAESIYVSGQTSDYAERVAEARSRNRAVRILPERRARDRNSVSVGVAAEHGDMVNNGTVHMAARPFFDRAVVEAGASVDGIARKLLKA
jgi:HK97 gp10 family phage protein